MLRLRANPQSLEPIRLTEQNVVRRFASRIAFFHYLVVVVFLILVFGFWRLQIEQREFYQLLAESNRLKSLPIPAPRGKILDRDGRVLVDNHASFSLLLSRELLKSEHLPWIAQMLQLDLGELQARLARFDNTPRYQPVVIKEELSQQDLAVVEAHRDRYTFPELDLLYHQRRLYPQGGLAAHLLGYVGEISEAELEMIQFAYLEPGDLIGKAGVERTYNHILMGVDGKRQVVVDSTGREVAVVGEKSAIPGKDIQLTIDLDLQVVAELAMAGKNGAVVALNPQTGEILAMVSRPTFDPNRLAGRIASSEWLQLIQDPSTPLLNRAIQAQVAPGSTFKPFVAIAALEEGVVDKDFTVFCRGGATFYGRYFRCHRRGGHGTVNLYRAIADSCDVYFYSIGNKLGIDRIAEYARQFGFGERTGIDLPHEATGLVPDSKWKLRTFRQKWYAGETISVAIGQGALTATPLQLAYAYGGLACYGEFHRPHVLKDPALNEAVRKVDLNRELVQQVLRGLWGVVNDYGTGVRARIPGVDVCGKTGTAQRISYATMARLDDADKFKDNAWFVGFTPCEEPEIVVAVLFEGGEHGYLAAPIARDVIKAYLDKKARQKLTKDTMETAMRQGTSRAVP